MLLTEPIPDWMSCAVCPGAAPQRAAARGVSEGGEGATAQRWLLTAKHGRSSGPEVDAEASVVEPVDGRSHSFRVLFLSIANSCEPRRDAQGPRLTSVAGSTMMVPERVPHSLVLQNSVAACTQRAEQSCPSPQQQRLPEGRQQRRPRGCRAQSLRARDRSTRWQTDRTHRWADPKQTRAAAAGRRAAPKRVRVSTGCAALLRDLVIGLHQTVLLFRDLALHRGSSHQPCTGRLWSFGTCSALSCAW